MDRDPDVDRDPDEGEEEVWVVVEFFSVDLSVTRNMNGGEWTYRSRGG